MFNIAYANSQSNKADEREQILAAHKKTVDKMFSRAFDECKNNDLIKINNNKAFEWSITNTADYALEYTLWIYLEKAPSTKVTSTIRKHLIATKYKINEAVYSASVIENVCLATPALTEVELKQSS